MEETLKIIEDSIEGLTDPNEKVDVTLTKHQLQMLRDGLIIHDALIEKSFELLNKYY